MQVTLGVCLDRRLGPSQADAVDAPILGRLGFLGLLETYLGLQRPDVSWARRVTSYLGHLRQHDNGARFYSRSLQADSIGTAAMLLSWRDEWRLAGWDGTVPSDAPQRLREMSLVEQSAAVSIEPGEAERLSDVALAMAMASETTPIESVLLVDPLESFPLGWRQVLALLPNVVLWQPEPQGQDQLRQLQERAFGTLRDGKVQALDAPVTDGSVLLVRASTREVAEQWLSASCRSAAIDRLLLCEGGGDSLDATMMATGAAGSGFPHLSALRPPLQAVGLALEMCWAPIDVGRLIEFLSHPVGPFSRKARAALARVVDEQPGIGGEAWAAFKREIPEDDRGAALLENIEFWLEGERWSRDAGAPLGALLARVDRLVAALRVRLSGDEVVRAALLPAIDQCMALRAGMAGLQEQGVAVLSSRQVEQLIVYATPAGCTNPSSFAQVGGLRAEVEAGACIEAADEVIWWMPSTPTLPLSLPWSQIELTALKQQGVVLRDPQQELDALAREWLLPLLAARKRFTLVLPPAGAEEHPFQQLLCSLVPDLLSHSIDLDLQLGSDFVGELSTGLMRMELPRAPRHIELGRSLSLPTEGQSYSSLSELYDDPALYALKRIARLRATTVFTAEEDNRLLGTLAHRVFERLFLQAGSLAWPQKQAVEWFRDSVDELLKTEGAQLLMQGAGVSQHRFRAVCENAICSLLDHLQAAGATAVRTEVELEGCLGDVQLIGKADLLVELPNGRSVILDMKWGGEKRYADYLREGQHLQLAFYSTLLEQQTGLAPAALGYFILGSGAMFVTVPDVMPKAQVRTPPVGATGVLLQQARESWKWRSRQLADGQIDVVPIEAGDDYQGPEGTLPVKGPRQWEKDYLVLLGGWEQ